MSDYRVFVEKYPRFRVEADSLRNELNRNLSLSIKELRLINVYDLFGFSRDLLEKCRYRVFGEVVTDTVTDDCEIGGRPFLAVEYLPGQFDQRAASAIDCVHLIDPSVRINIKSSRLLIFDDGVSRSDLARIEHYYVNTVESRVKDLSVLSDMDQAEVRPVPVLEGLRNLKDGELREYCEKMRLSMNAADLKEVVKYFNNEGRDPNETELRILDTYWSDHCRHTTFTSVIEHIRIDDSFIADEMRESYDEYLRMRKELGREEKDICLMDLATIGARYLRKKGLLDDLEVSEENNACSIYVDVDVDGQTQKWLLQFKNETHNHPTEIEPFGGASTCLGGAIRDPLSGRSYVYQAMRVTGAGNIYAGVDETLEGKLPQKVISTKAAAGYSSYGNQIGLATTYVREIYHDDYVAKRLEVGAVVGAVKASAVRRESPKAGDVILMLGGRTGRDGVGGATGSSKEHNAKSLYECSSEVQKGNAPEERKLQRLFRRPEATRLIKKSNDFGAGGVSVAIGELAEGLRIYLDRVPVKYSGLNATELAISESQERMAVVIDACDREEFERYCHEENLEVTHVADVTDSGRLQMFYKDKAVVDMARSFIDSAGAKHFADAEVAAVEDRNPFERKLPGDRLRDRLVSNLSDKNVLSQKGLVEMFDSTIGATTVLMPFGGRSQETEAQVSLQKLPVLDGNTNTASVMSAGYNPYIAEWSPYHGAAYAVVESVAKIAASGADYSGIRFSFQEYFERMSSPESWGKPFASLLGALKMQTGLGLPSIGGKDSMSGTFKHLNVPPMLMSFAITTVDARKVISPEFKKAASRLALVRHRPLKDRMPDLDALKSIFAMMNREISSGNIISAYAIGFGGAAEAVCKMSFGNSVGAEVSLAENDMFDYSYGSFIIECSELPEHPSVEEIGRTIAEPVVRFRDRISGESAEISIADALEANKARFETVYPDCGVDSSADFRPYEGNRKALVYKGEAKEHPVVYIPVFPGTNCDYDSMMAFRRAGAVVRTDIFLNLTGQDVLDSIDRMCRYIDSSDIIMLSGGFSSGDEPDGSGKFIANVLNNASVTAAVHRLLDRGGLILGICNGFQALVKSGLLPYGRLGMLGKESPTLFRNDVNRHISRLVTTRVASVASPWLSGFRVGDRHVVPVSHGEGKFVVSDSLAEELFSEGQVAFQYEDNPNGSTSSIEGIISKDGQILGKMGHSERCVGGLYRNCPDFTPAEDLFANAVAYFRKK